MSESSHGYGKYSRYWGMDKVSSNDIVGAIPFDIACVCAQPRLNILELREEI